MRVVSNSILNQDPARLLPRNASLSAIRPERAKNHDPVDLGAQIDPDAYGHVQRGRLLARIEYVEAVASRPGLIVTGDNAIAYGVPPALGFSPSLPSGVLRRKWPNPLRALLGEMKVVWWVNTYLTA